MALKSPINMCTPAQIYLGLSLISIIAFSLGGTDFLAMIWHLFLSLLWTYFLSFLCDKGHSGISWFLVLFPFLIVITFVLLFGFALSKMHAAKQSTTTNLKSRQ